MIMAKKIRWSNCLLDEWKRVRKICKMTGYSEEQAVIYINKKDLLLPQNSYDNVLKTNLSMLLYYDFTKKTLHLYFMDKELRDFLQENVLMNYDDLKSYIKENGNFYPVNYFNYSKDAQVFDYPVCIHIPYEKQGYSFNYQIINGEFNLVAENKKHFMIEEYKYKYLSKLKEADLTEVYQECLRLYRLAFNTLAYIYCFPEYIKDGVPNIGAEIKSDINRKKLETSTELKEVIADSLHNKNIQVPHIVRGHFMYLKDKRYTNKKGEIVWRKAHMAKGNAKTVYTNEKLLDK